MSLDKRLQIFSEAEKFAFYGVPDFNHQQRIEFFSFTENELALITYSLQAHLNLYCALQLAYFKAKKMFFQLSWDKFNVLDVEFAHCHHFDKQEIVKKQITNYELYEQRNMIVGFYNYKLWSAEFFALALQKSAQIIKRDLNPNFIARELIIFFQNQKIVRPGLTTLQDIVTKCMHTERLRIHQLLLGELNEEDKLIIENLTASNDALSKLSALKQDAKNFKFKMMTKERQKLTILEPVYQIARNILPKLQISNQNIENYSQLASYYDINRLRELKFSQAHLYLLCYAFKRYRQLTDNIVNAFNFHLRQINGEAATQAKNCFNEAQINSQIKEAKLLALYVNKKFISNQQTLFTKVLQKAYQIMPQEQIQALVERMLNKGHRKKEFYWQAIDKASHKYKKHLRPLLSKLTFASSKDNHHWLQAINWLQTAFKNNKPLKDYSFSAIPVGTIPKNIRKFLLTNTTANYEALNAERYEYFIYKQIGKNLDSGCVHIEDSMSYGCFENELVNAAQQAAILETLDIPWFRIPLAQHLNTLATELNQLWQKFDQALKTGELKHLQYDVRKQKLTVKKIYDSKYEKLQHNFYSQLGTTDIGDVLRFVDERCNFSDAFTPLQPRYAKHVPEKPKLIAALLAQAFGHGNHHMAASSDISYEALEVTCQQYLRLSCLREANDLISNRISKLAIYPHFALDLELIYSSVDGQRYGVATPNIRARHSKKDFNKGQGVSAYTLLSDHIPLRCQIISDHESYYAFDIWYNNTSEIIPDVITGDMHVRNKANSAVLGWFGVQLQPRFANLSAELTKIYCADDLALYKDFLVKPTDQINSPLICNQKSRVDQFVVSLAQKEISQATLIKKLCHLSPENHLRKAVFEYDKLRRSIYTLKYALDPKLQKKVNHSQNRVEEYHQLKAAIAKVSGKKQLYGKTDIDIEISNQCCRLIANAIIYYNALILSELLEKYEKSQDKKILALIKKISPIAWQHINFLGHYIFQNNTSLINIEEVLKNIIFS